MGIRLHSSSMRINPKSKKNKINRPMSWQKRFLDLLLDEILTTVSIISNTSNWSSMNAETQMKEQDNSWNNSRASSVAL